MIRFAYGQMVDANLALQQVLLGFTGAKWTEQRTFKLAFSLTA